MKPIFFTAVAKISTLAIFSLLPNFVCAADVYKCTDNSGKTIFSDKKCSEDAVVIKNAEIHTRNQGNQDQKNHSDAPTNPNDDAVLSRWLPRLKDPSREVREEAGKKISEIAVNNPAYRNQLIPTLMAHCKKEESWPVVTNGILYPLGDLSEDPQWREKFLDLYIFLAEKNNYGTGDNGYRGIWESIEKGFVDTNHPQFQKILTLANKGKDAKYPPDNNVNDLRLYSMKILDWYNDLPKK